MVKIAVRRALGILRGLLMLADIMLCFAWLAPLYLIGGERWAARPNGHQMVSAYIGRAAINGHRWARRAARIIDWTFERLGDRPDHCARAARHYAGFAD